MSAQYQGPVVTITKVHGFLWCEQLGRRVFFHFQDVAGPNPKVGEVYEFILAPSQTPGKPEQARKLHLVVGGAA